MFRRVGGGKKKGKGKRRGEDGRKDGRQLDKWKRGGEGMAER